MDKRYQIFISSTFIDLKEERQAVLKSILELDHMPAGMELFPATDDTAWTLIQDVIDSSDYYVLIVGGRYGSLDETGIGYTEKEYDYAVKNKKPVIPLLHENPDNLPREKTETDKAAWEKLKEFRSKIEKNHTCVYWANADELKAKVIIGLTAAIKRHPAVGWVRADKVPSDATIVDILSLRQRITELEIEIELTRSTPPQGTEDLMQGKDSYEMETIFLGRSPGGDYYSYKKYRGKISPSWNEIFAGVAPVMINEATEQNLRKAFKNYLTIVSKAEFEEISMLKDHQLKDFTFREDEIDTAMIQLRALGLIKENDKKRSVRDTATYWTLTPYGDQLMVQLRAINRKPPESKRIGDEAKVTEEVDES